MSLLLIHSWTSIVGPLFASSGAFTLLLSMYFHRKEVAETRSTIGFDLRFLIFACVTAVCFISSSILSISSGEAAGASLGMDISMLVVQAFALYANIWVYFRKKSNLLASKDAGLSEKEYYREFILPSIDFLRKYSTFGYKWWKCRRWLADLFFRFFGYRFKIGDYHRRVERDDFEIENRMFSDIFNFVKGKRSINLLPFKAQESVKN